MNDLPAFLALRRYELFIALFNTLPLPPADIMREVDLVMAWAFPLSVSESKSLH